LRELLAGGGRTAVRDMVLMNASAALYVAGKASSFKEGVTLAKTAFGDGRATRSCEAYVAASQGR